MLGREAPVVAEVGVLVQAEHGLRVPYVRGEQHRASESETSGWAGGGAGRAGSDAVICRFVEEVQNGKSEAVADELNDPAFVNLSSPPGIPSDREGGKTFLFGFLNAFPDSRFTIDDMIAEGDQVVTKKTFTGTHTGEFAGIPATGNKVTLQFVDIMRVRNGRIVEHWLSMDQLSFMQQLGVIPTPGQDARDPT
ncbi:MAG: ester cyclase [Actinobacteria bacterium]|nr:MAG: ester cyclase [Actinomycetota bacterium]